MITRQINVQGKQFSIELCTDPEMPLKNWQKGWFAKAERAIRASQKYAGAREKINSYADLHKIELKQATYYMVTATINDEFDIVVECLPTDKYTQYKIGEIVG